MVSSLPQNGAMGLMLPPAQVTSIARRPQPCNFNNRNTHTQYGPNNTMLADRAAFNSQCSPSIRTLFLTIPNCRPLTAPSDV
jgi:hypothetical protein